MRGLGVLAVVLLCAGCGASQAQSGANGKLDPNVVANVIRSHKGAIIACYEEGLLRDRNLAGAFRVRFTIQADGSVTGPVIEDSTLHDDTVLLCALDRVRAWRFPEPAGGPAQFSYPFVLRTAER